MHFNQDYLDFLDEYLDDIRWTAEPEFSTITMTEPDFNRSLSDFGYEVADKDFSKLQTRIRTPVEAWDHRKGDCVYAVKFGTAQKLDSVVDQANLVLELVRNRANVRRLPSFRQYCLWLGYESKRPIERISQSGSIILRQKIEAWARRAADLRIEPVLKISHRPN